ncbi:hypothetical protein GF1_10660 [Desulfolithobacter dissulfuricans]|uniref:Uncharacterized protein n=1 Tax=Desulfolithobacter dissulfuricans TaxID=2795293 RepID=A0A915U9S7_9BACT|nr:hypothetical protein GF1_10660 [Desulfolithobacter dissulfuricans]
MDGLVQVGDTHQGDVGEVAGDILLALAENGPLAHQHLQILLGDGRIENAQRQVGRQEDIVDPVAISYFFKQTEILFVLPFPGIIDGHDGQLHLAGGKGFDQPGGMGIEPYRGTGGIHLGGLPGVAVFRSEGGYSQHDTAISTCLVISCPVNRYADTDPLIHRGLFRHGLRSRAGI